MEVPRVNGRVIQKVKVNVPCPATRGVREECRVRGNMTWCHVGKGGRVGTEEQALVREVPEVMNRSFCL